MKSIIDKFRSLPQACRAFDSVWDAEKQRREIAELEHQLERARSEYSEIHDRMLADLRKYWSDEEIHQAGLLETK
jgi:hypothetical protein